MSKIIYKYHVPLGGDFSLEMPEGAKLLTVQNQYGDHKLWALVDTDAPIRERRFAMYGTGFDLEEQHESAAYVATAQFGGGQLVLHLFDLGEA
jgi:hypothetical protein